MKKDQSGFSAVLVIFVFFVIGVIGFVGWYIHKTKNDKKAQETAILSINAARPTKQKEVDDIINKMDFGVGSLLASSKVDSCHQVDLQEADFTVGSQYECYYRRKLFVGYPSSPAKMVNDMNSFAKRIGFKYDPAHLEVAGFTPLDEHCYYLLDADWAAVQYMEAEMFIFDLSIPIKKQMCHAHDQVETEHQTSGTEPTFTIHQIVDEAKIEQQAKVSGMQSLVVITITNPVGYYK